VRTILTAEQFRWAIERESQRVDRLNAGELTLVLFRVSPGARRRANVRLIRTILSRVRVTDDVGWFDREHIGLLLADTPAAGAWPLAQSICQVVARHGRQPLCSMYNYPGNGENGPAAAITRADVPEVFKAAS
jgi:hypothetical protein